MLKVRFTTLFQNNDKVTQITFFSEENVLPSQSSARLKSFTKPRNSFTVKQKLDIVRLIQPSVPGKSIRSIGKQKGLDESTVRKWMKNREKLKEFRSNDDVKIRNRRRLPGGGRRAFLPELEKELLSWVIERNSLGLRVKDKLIAPKQCL